MIFFFFQAEDGIRDVAVTGVQTCALPIFRQHGAVRANEGGIRRGDPRAARAGLRRHNRPAPRFARHHPDRRRDLSTLVAAVVRRSYAAGLSRSGLRRRADRGPASRVALPGGVALSLRRRIRTGAVLLGPTRPPQQTARRLHAPGSAGAGPHLQGLRARVRPAVRLPRVGPGRPAAGTGRVARADGLAACAERHVTPETADTRPSRRVLLFSITLVAGLAVVLATHRQQARGLGGRLPAGPPAGLAAGLRFVLCRRAFQPVAPRT